MNLIEWVNPGKSPERRSKTIIFLLCLLFSLLAWFSIKISRETSVIIPLEVNVNNVPDDLLFTHRSDSTFLLSLQTTGIRILTSRTLRSRAFFETDFQALQRSRGNDENVFFITAQQAELRYSIQNEIPRQQIKIHPDTLFFSATEAFRKIVPVVVEKNLEFRQGFRLYGFASVVPDSVVVTGPVELRDSIHSISTAEITGTEVDANIRRIVSLVNPLPGRNIMLSEQSAQVLIPAEEFTESQAELPLSLICQEIFEDFPSSRVLLFPDRVTIFYLVALKDIRTITADMFKASVGCPDTLAPARSRLRVDVTEKPGLVEIIRVRPVEVEYVWIKN